MKPLHRTALIVAGISLAAALAAGLTQAQTPTAADTARGEQLFTERCATCHVNPRDRAPPKASLAALGPDTILQALKTGIMAPQASGLAPADLSALAVYLTGKAPSAPATGPVPIVNPCAKADKISLTPSWNGWSPDLVNSRLQPNSGLKAADIPKLKVKWTFAYPGSKNSQVTVTGDRLFIGSTTGTVYSLNARTGCTYWRYDAPGAVRAAPVVARLATSPSGYVVYISDFTMAVHALDAVTGQVLWTS
ncbi:MAG: PQQ-binding-like beta-propeller repeat protein, partial [Alphaproteobacteria bacterium]